MKIYRKTKCSQCNIPLFETGVGKYDRYFFEDESLEIEHIEERCLTIQKRNFEENFKTQVIQDVLNLQKEVVILKQKVEWLRGKTNIEQD